MLIAVPDVDWLRMKQILLQAALLSAVTASFSFTITETKILEPFRKWIRGKNEFLSKLFSCGYCMGHWIALVLVGVFQVKIFNVWWLADYFLGIVVIAWLAGFQWAFMCILMEKAGK